MATDAVNEVFRIAKLMALLEDEDCSDGVLSQHLPTCDAGWEVFFKTAVRNSVLSHLCAALCARPTLLATISEAEQHIITVWHATFQEKALQERAAIEEIDHAISHAAPLTEVPILLKGAVRLFDDLYPTLAYRTRADVDLYYGDPALLTLLAGLGYGSVEPDLFELGEPVSDKLERLHHHLPSIRKTEDSVRIELHLQLIGRLGIGCALQRSEVTTRPCPGLAHIVRLSAIDEFKLAFANTYLCDRGSMNLNMRLRGVYETWLLFDILSEAERQEARDQITKAGYGPTLNFASFLTQKLFGAAMYPHQMTMRARFEFWKYKALRRWPRLLPVVFLVSYSWDLIVRRMWNRELWPGIIGAIGDWEEFSFKAKRFLNVLRTT